MGWSDSASIQRMFWGILVTFVASVGIVDAASSDEVHRKRHGALSTP